MSTNGAELDKLQSDVEQLSKQSKGSLSKFLLSMRHNIILIVGANDLSRNISSDGITPLSPLEFEGD